MRNLREENNSRRFTREEWLTSTQIKSFLSRLAASRRKAANKQALEATPEEIGEELIDELEAESPRTESKGCLERNR
jgi:hypothetical protein